MGSRARDLIGNKVIQLSKPYSESVSRDFTLLVIRFGEGSERALGILAVEGSPRSSRVLSCLCFVFVCVFFPFFA